MISLNLKANAILKKKVFVWGKKKKAFRNSGDVVGQKKTVSESICKEPIARKVTNKKSEKDEINLKAKWRFLVLKSFFGKRENFALTDKVDKKFVSTKQKKKIIIMQYNSQFIWSIH